MVLNAISVVHLSCIIGSGVSGNGTGRRRHEKVL